MPQEGHVLYEAGIDNYISKPFDFEQIQRMLQYAAAEQTDPVMLQEQPTSEAGTLTENLSPHREAEDKKEQSASGLENFIVKSKHDSSRN
jgi:hypothetical protein